MDSHPADVKQPSMYSWLPAGIFFVLTMFSLNTDSESLMIGLCITFAVARGMYGFGFTQGRSFQKYHGEQ